MAASTILTILSNVPWSQVIDAAPKVAEGATKLWNSVIRNKGKDLPNQSKEVESSHSSAAKIESIEEVRVQLESIQLAVGNLREEMQSATELIKILAEQNTALVQRVELNRLRLVRQNRVIAALGIVMFVMVFYSLIKM